MKLPCPICKTGQVSAAFGRQTIRVPSGLIMGSKHGVPTAIVLWDREANRPIVPFKVILKDLREIGTILEDAEMFAPKSRYYEAAVILMSALSVGAHGREICEYTGLSVETVKTIWRRYRANGIFPGGGAIHCGHWFTDGGIRPFDFVLDVMVGTGEIHWARIEEEGGEQTIYYASGPKGPGAASSSSRVGRESPADTSPDSTQPELQREEDREPSPTNPGP